MTKNGILLLNKPPGISSARALNPVKRRFRGQKVGHTGTLDPFASGLLVVMVGHATRFSDWLLKLDKRYEARMQIGVETSTLDPEGEPVASGPIVSFAAIEAAARRWVGTIQQEPPAYSALKVNGMRAYQRARRGETVTMPARAARVDEIRVVATEHADHVDLMVACASGTYIRSLARDIARTAGTRGSLIALHRSAVGPFHDRHAYQLDEIESGDREITLIPMVAALRQLGAAEPLTVCVETATHVRHGKPLRVALTPGEYLALQSRRHGSGATQLPTLLTTPDTEVVALVAEERGEWHYRAVFPAAENAAGVAAETAPGTATASATDSNA
jgi:tRNA pseudouridine55 synthase